MALRTSSLPDWAAFYASKGLPVFPLKPAGKTPLVNHWPDEATTDIKQISMWWKKWPDANIGIATGTGKLPLCVLDVDINHAKGKFGDDTLRDLVEHFGDLPETWLCLTGGGGLHHYFLCNDPTLTIGADVLPGLDFRGRGGYVVAPPSLHESGKRYEWENSNDPEDGGEPAQLPGWLHDLLLRGKQPDARKYTNEAPNTIAEGSRNQELFRLACSFRAKGLSVEEMLPAVLKLNDTRCRPPLSSREVETICRSAGRYEKGSSAAPRRSSTLIEFLEAAKPERNDRYPWNDIGNGNLFADCYRGEARYVPERKKWFVFNGCVWEPDTGNLRVMELCKQLADVLVCYALSLPEGAERDSYRKFVEVWQRRNHRETILKDAASVFPVKISEFDADPYLFNCTNGTLDLKNRELRPHSADDLLTMIAGVRYDPEAGSETFENFLLEVMSGDTETATYVQKVLGYCLTGDTSEECFFTLYGATTRNGKSTLLETFLRLLGDYGRSAKPETFALKKTANGSGPSEDLARLAGARMISVSEVPRGMHLDASLMKTITGGDTITARFLCENSFEYRPQFKQIFNTNWLPTASDVTLFSSDRVRVIPFERHFTEAERDKTLKARLSAPVSLSGILNWCLKGLQMWRETGLEPSDAVKKATAQYQLDSDKIAQFIDEELEAGPEYEVRSSEAFAQYKYWCGQNGYHYGSDRTWRDDMKRLVVFERRRPKTGGDKTTLIRGYRLKEAM